MSLEIRRVEPDEWATFIRVADFAFGRLRSDEDVAWMVESLRQFTCRGAFDRGRMVATSLDYVSHLTLPGGLQTPVVAITWVGTLPTDRRRGAMRGLMDATLEDARAAGIDRAALWVSEYPLYSRFGFGPAAAAWVEITVDTVHGAFAEPFRDPGRVRMLDAAAARELLPAAYERSRLEFPGEVARVVDDWRHTLSDSRLAKRFVVVHEDAAGAADGFAIYRYDADWREAVPDNELRCYDLVWANQDAHASLWRYLLDMDLVKTVNVELRPIDDPIRLLLANPRRARIGKPMDTLWVKLLDAPRALAARRYAADGALAIEVDGSRLLLEASEGQAACTPTEREPDLAMAAGALASCHLGGHRFTELSRAGMVQERRPGSLIRADQMFMAERAPWCSSEF